eukprot:CAMPEP_0201539466 /NCGR_PEP_ID=MMETSP0161_2-20130828/70422_1 /ASSEMBLY_ACC=CAM_ASM_000251 /TAXON_ID=180227 /ORGANISM="Neoparamoeba aestuarina, Strain SoJaBio B1-5/56/2" /LENGTH=88 /DNA_ID=CAMNT_0047946863 /DNA_START=69 /DNA_END=332 /DNA_ORIENTATION=+
MADFPSTLEGNSPIDKLHSLCKLTYKQQAVWYLNAFWSQTEAETLWDFVEKCSKIDNAGAGGNGLDELEAHRFLEGLNDAHTVLEMRS